MQKLALFCFIFLSTAVNAFALSLQSYQELSSAMRSGKRFVIIANLQECTGKSNMPIGYFIPSKMMLVPASEVGPERILTSDLHFTNYIGKPVYEYVKYTFHVDDSVELRTVSYDPLDFKPINTAHVIHGTIGKAILVHASDESKEN